MQVLLGENIKMSKYIDLSYRLENELYTHPYDDKMKLYKNRFLDTHRYNDTRLEMSMHVGTHIDVVSHLTDQEIYISDYPLEKFMARGCLLDVRNESVITMKNEYLDKVNEGDIVLLYTGYDAYFGMSSYFDNHPSVEKELAQFFVERKIKLLGIDMPSPDHYPFEIHKILLEKDILIIENMRNMQGLKGLKEFEVIAVPLSIRAEAAPARVIAKLN